jgi:hypothetical protein
MQRSAASAALFLFGLLFRFHVAPTISDVGDRPRRILAVA